MTVFVLDVEGQLDQFKEKGQRDIKAFRPDDAVDAVYEAGLGALIRQAVAYAGVETGPYQADQAR